MGPLPMYGSKQYTYVAAGWVLSLGNHLMNIIVRLWIAWTGNSSLHLMLIYTQKAESLYYTWAICLVHVPDQLSLHDNS